MLGCKEDNSFWPIYLGFTDILHYGATLIVGQYVGENYFKSVCRIKVDKLWIMKWRYFLEIQWKTMCAINEVSAKKLIKPTPERSQKGKVISEQTKKCF